jgi:hypothetical protein
MKSILLLIVVAALMAVFGAFVLPPAASVEQPQALASERPRVVLASVGRGDDGNACTWERNRDARTTVFVNRDA